jgi:UDPglucose--hexose-1-phosphate uridylyltransferase
VGRSDAVRDVDAPGGGSERLADHLHIEFTPPYRARDRLKYLAGCETGAGTFINDTLPEETAAELRAARSRA